MHELAHVTTVLALLGSGSLLGAAPFDALVLMAWLGTLTALLRSAG